MQYDPRLFQAKSAKMVLAPSLELGGEIQDEAKCARANANLGGFALGKRQPLS